MFLVAVVLVVNASFFHQVQELLVRHSLAFRFHSKFFHLRQSLIKKRFVLSQGVVWAREVVADVPVDRMFCRNYRLWLQSTHSKYLFIFSRKVVAIFLCLPARLL